MPAMTPQSELELQSYGAYQNTRMRAFHLQRNLLFSDTSPSLLLRSCATIESPNARVAKVDA